MARQFDPFREVDRWFGDMRTPASTAMPMDLYREGDAFVAKVDLPGVDPKSIDVDVDERTLTIRAERPAVQKQEQQKWLVRERPAGTFARQLTLGYGVALDKIEAAYADGVLTLQIPVAEEAKPRKISVSHADSSKVVSPAESKVIEGSTEQ